MPDDLILGTTAIAACVGFAAANFCYYSVTKLRRNENGDSNGYGIDGDVRSYVDEDGRALHDQTSKKRTIGSRVLAFLLAGVASFAVAFIYDPRHLGIKSGMIYAGWTLTDIATLIFCFEQGLGRYTTGNVVSLNSLALSLASVIVMISGTKSDNFDLDERLHEALCWVQLISGICLAWVAASVPRRPSVYVDGVVVDALYTCSASERYTFAWIQPFLYKARKQEMIALSDIPLLEVRSRTQVLKEKFPKTNMPYGARNSLWKSIARAHWTSYLWTWSICVAEGIVIVLPAACLYQILDILEANNPAQSIDKNKLGLWIFCLTMSKFSHIFLDTRIIWHAFSIAINVRAQLSALIYAKALRMRITAGSIRSGSKTKQNLAVKSPASEDISNAVETDPLLPARDTKVAEGVMQDAKDEAETEKVAREVISLLGMDVTRVYIFAGWNATLVRGVVKILIAMVFFVALLGWWSALAGLVVPLILYPLNRFVTSWYSKSMVDVSNARDHNTYVVTEALHGIRQIKLSASEPRWKAAILASRGKLLRAQWKRYLGDAYLFTSWAAMPILMGAASLSVFAIQYHDMTASIAFTVLAIFSSLEWTICGLPSAITEMIDASVSCKRLEEFFNSDEQEDLCIGGDRITIKDATISWPSTDGKTHFTLSNLDLEFPPQQLSVIYGKTGSGKSLLLAAILGEAEVLAGLVQVPDPGSTHSIYNEHIPPEQWIVPTARAFVSQVPWIENASLRESILFGLPYSQHRYDQVVEVCALNVDIKSFPDKDDTEIGETGINLSGGQRWRLTLARALYSRAGIIIMDDIFSAVDTHVGRHLLRHAITGKLAYGRTMILATHHLELVMDSASYFVDLDKGRALSPEETLKTTSTSSDDVELPDPSRTSQSDALEEESSAVTEVLEKTKPRKFVEDEIRAKGRVSLKVYATYLRASGGPLPWLLTLLIFLLSATLTVSRSYSLVLWIESYSSSPTQPLLSSSLPFFLCLYLTLSTLSILSNALKSLTVYSLTFASTRELFSAMTSAILRATRRWHDAEPAGRILNRFVADFTTVDHLLGLDVNLTLDGTFHLLTIVVAALLVSAWMVVPLVVLVSASVYVVYLYLDGARDIKRIDSIARSPVLELVDSSLSGLGTIRSFGRVGAYLKRMEGLLDGWSRATRYSLLASSWVRFRQGAVGVLLTLTVAVVIACLGDSIDGALAGFALSFALNFSTVTDDTLLRYTALELEMNCVERVVEYTSIESEPLDGEDPPASWPAEGKIEVQDLEVAYAVDLPPVLKDISFVIPAGRRVGIVGRTGSGKTSLTLALFRLLEPRSGRMLIDGIDTATLRLSELRRKLAIIPQDPVLFSGTLRSNLDPEETFDDVTLLDALRRVHLIGPSSSPTAEELDGGDAMTFRDLSFPVSRGGANLSQGQKQLLCLARAILTQPKILVLDEATSAVDMATDVRIRRSLSEDFPGTTMLVVAHRLSTVADMDLILVMRDGEVAEFDKPGILARREAGVFRGLLEGSGEELLKKLLVAQ